MSLHCTSETPGDVRVESVVRREADIDQQANSNGGEARDGSRATISHRPANVVHAALRAFPIDPGYVA